MDAIRRYVFPLIWILIFAIIALALARLAFFPADADANAGEGPEVPAAEFDQYATVPVETGDISSDLTLPAVVEADAGTELKATDEGEINKIWAREGDTVEKGQKILQVRVPEEAEPVEALPEPAEGEGEGEGEGDEITEQPAPEPQETEQQYKYLTLSANASGKITGLELEEWDPIAKGDVVASISPGTYSIVADLTPEQQLSLLDQKITASATLPTSSEPVRCDAPGITEDSGAEKPEPAPAEEPAAEGSAPEEMDMPAEEGAGSGASVAELECPVPAGTKVVPGLAVEVNVALGAAEGVLMVPTTAVEGEGEAGTVYLLDEETGEPVPVDVTLGLRSEGLVEITEGVEEGQEVLQFVPGVDNEMIEMGEGEMW